MLGIKTMKVPKCCRECNFKYYDEGEDVLCCALEDGYIPDVEVDEKRLECCPLVETDNEPITKNDLPNCQHTDEEIAKSFIEDVEAAKDQLPCGERMGFPSTFDEFAKDYGFRDKEEIYTNGSELIPVFRVKQWIEHISTTKNDLEVLDKIRAEIEESVLESLSDGGDDWFAAEKVNECLDIIDKYKKEGEQE